MDVNETCHYVLNLGQVSAAIVQDLDWKFVENDWDQTRIQVADSPKILMEHVRKNFKGHSLSIVRVLLPRDEVKELKKVLKERLGPAWVAFVDGNGKLEIR